MTKVFKILREHPLPESHPGLRFPISQMSNSVQLKKSQINSPREFQPKRKLGSPRKPKNRFLAASAKYNLHLSRSNYGPLKDSKDSFLPEMRPHFFVSTHSGFEEFRDKRLRKKYKHRKVSKRKGNTETLITNRPNPFYPEREVAEETNHIEAFPLRRRTEKRMSENDTEISVDATTENNSKEKKDAILDSDVQIVQFEEKNKLSLQNMFRNLTRK
ncbi:hypothetical protein CEXT_211781 [Caerostris extrusa]|uniref:Uncharacterized protein n=1 Tax=Caerostris extrusa TaxID=172846 RepID=A0AAV4PJH6_CAEEX|nr:hypothetical protein CEXT_211781 [Caerostris extrusa]